jgi:predicted CoA-substrate-specific enzyme activase
VRLIGLDFSSVYFKGIVINQDNRIDHSWYCKNTGNTIDLLESFFEKISRLFPGEKFKAGITGISVSDDSSNTVYYTNEIIALASGILPFCPDCRSIIEIGGQTSKFVLLKQDGNSESKISEFSTNELCAAGTGSFIEQQAKRLNLTVEELSDLSVQAKRHARIAGRCSVFAKSDMIHLQQKGTPLEEIAYGLCLAIARNACTILMKGRELEAPTVISGGCARNKGIARGFSETFNYVIGSQLIPFEFPGLEGAIGSAFAADKHIEYPTNIYEIEENIKKLLSQNTKTFHSGFPPLRGTDEPKRISEPENILSETREGYLGIDVGAVSTDLAVLDRDGNIISSVYLPTRGRPVDVIMEELSILNDRFRGGLRVLGCGTTGSGRYLAAKLMGADVVKNEITCQMLGAHHYFKDVDTIFEIGGQDSKFISVKDGRIVDFVMNKICAAGTGSFLEEQATQLDLSIFDEFADLSFKSRTPSDLGSRCTVFMETELLNARKSGVSREDICAGLSYSIVKNYLEKVVAGRSIGHEIVFSGGVASNDAVVAAFSKKLGKSVSVHPFNRISGAIGAALAAKLYMNSDKSQFSGLNFNLKPKVRSFECKGCSNFCEVNTFEIENRRVFFGDVCEKYTSKGAKRKDESIPNIAEEYIKSCESFFKENRGERGTIGIPRASSLIAYLPFWATFFSELGFAPVLSEPSSEETLTNGLKHLPVGACLPLKLTAGHLLQLVEEGVNHVFIPAVLTLPGDDRRNSFTCPYVQSIPFMVKMNQDNFIAPELMMDGNEKSFIKAFLKCSAKFNFKKTKLLNAYRKASIVQQEFESHLKKTGESLLTRSKCKYKFAVIGKPYNTFDAYLTLNLFAHLRKLDVLAIPLNYLPFNLEEISANLPWKFSVDILRAVKKISETEDIYPVILSNFGCGPDAFTFKQFTEIMEDKPYLMLEFDEHRAETGLITRLEAFIDRLDMSETNKSIKKSKPARPTSARESGLENTKIYLPYFADHAYAFSGALKFAGLDAEVLLPPDGNIKKLGETHSSGKECHAYSILVGDLINLHKREPGRQVIYLFPGTTIPCLLHQYGNGMNILLKELGIDHVKVMTPASNDFFRILSMEGCERLYQGILAIDLMVKAICEVRPYEVNPGATDLAHRQNLQDIERAGANGDLLDALDRSLKRIAEIKVNRVTPKPLVGVAGDIYTRINPAANDDLFKYLEHHGLEVWPAPFEVDILDFGIAKSFIQGISELNLPNTLFSGSLLLKKLIENWKFRRIVGRRIAKFKEPGYQEVIRLAGVYLENKSNDLLLLNVAKMVDFANNGIGGIINAMCFNCMIGTVSAAITERIKKDYNDLPIITLVYSGSEYTSQKMILDAFIDQVKANKSLCLDIKRKRV